MNPARRPSDTYYDTVVKSWAFSATYHWVLHGQCDRLRDFPTLFLLLTLDVFVISNTLHWLITNSYHKVFFSTIKHKTFLHSSYLHYNNIKVCNRSHRKIVLVQSQTILLLIKNTFTLWSIINMSAINNSTWLSNSG